MRVLPFFLLCLSNLGFFIGPAAFAADPSPTEISPADLSVLEKLAFENPWLRLTHYRSSLLGGYESEIDGPLFFIAPRGKTQPLDELVATYQAMLADTPALPEEEAAACRFPARRQFFTDRAPALAAKLPARECPRFEKWRQTVSGESASLIFSSFYLNNPSSMFGHSFLKLNKPLKNGKRFDLLDYGLNYAANPTTQNPLLYSVLGLMGGFKGVFTIMPYYYKVREYNNAESRDLWEYELNLAPAQVDLLVRHFWELGPAWADYYYLTENCSYHMLTLIEAVDPERDLTSHFGFNVIPGDTIKVIAEAPGLLREVRYRPSIHAEFTHRRGLLDREEDEVLYAILSDRVIPESFAVRAEDSRRRILDAALDGFDERYAVEVQMEGTPEFLFKAKLLGERSRVQAPTPTLKLATPVEEIPHLSHGSHRLGIGTGEMKRDGATGAGVDYLTYRYSLHDFLDPVRGYPDSAEIEMFTFDFRRDRARDAWDLDRFAFVDIKTMTRYSRFNPSLSWRLFVGADRERSKDAFGQLNAQVSGGAGRSYELVPRGLFYFGAHALFAHRIGAAVNAPKSYVSVGPALSWRQEWGSAGAGGLNSFVDLKALSESKRADVFTPSVTAGLHHQFTPTLGARASVERADEWTEGKLELMWYHQ